MGEIWGRCGEDAHLAEGGTVDVGWYLPAVAVEALLAGEVLLVARLGEI